MHLTYMSVLLIWLLRGVLGAPSIKDSPSYWASKFFPKTRSVYFLSKRASGLSIHLKNELCKKIGGYLVELNSRDEQYFVRRFLRAHSKYFAFTGANDVLLEGTFVYYNSKKLVPPLKWLRGYPKNSQNDKDCVLIGWRGLIESRCKHVGPYMCEIRA
ncbi:Cd209 antigen [Plakobranchus ocellatus]|uniref:Cd209 antigen n=1 Tax=Plakobranchus ocellatus TaxID=259542 RepID=A0AAV4AYQ8_9GAST|nr:Cd209 antigen [Plakobranchus ocellatus]